MVKLFIIFLGSQVATSEAFGVAKVGRVDDDGGDDDDDGEALKWRELCLEGRRQSAGPPRGTIRIESKFFG